MYKSYFGLKENPFSISPDPRYLYMSQRHREALAHLLYGTQQAGGFIQLTGEVGTGKTTLTRALLQQLPENVDIALLLNPKQTATEFLRSICDELRAEYSGELSSIKTFVDALNVYLLDAHKKGRHTVLLIDEAQNLTVDVLEQIRLLTNLETTKKKLLQIILVGQPELRVLLARKELRQLAQRITARYHLLPLTEVETKEFIHHRLSVAGQSKMFFQKSALKTVQSITKGVPRLINIICDRALLGAYSQGRHSIDAKIIKRASEEVMGKPDPTERVAVNWFKPAIAASLAILTVSSLFLVWDSQRNSVSQNGVITNQADRISGVVNNITNNVDNKVISNEELKPTAKADVNADSIEELEPVALVTEISDSGTTETVTAKLSTIEKFEESLSAVETENEPDIVDIIANLQMKKDNIAQMNSEAVVKTVVKTMVKTRVSNLNTLLLDESLKSDTSSAYAELFSQWSKDYYETKGSSACDKAQKQGLSCWHNKGTWNSLRMVNRPAVIELFDSSHNPHNVVVTSMEGNDVNLSFAGKTFTLPITEVDPYWYGTFVVLWRQPPVNLDSIHPGIRGSAALWLKLTLNKVDGIEVDGKVDNLFDSELEMRVKAFQKERYLDEDGVVGKRTMIHLNTALNDPTVPLLTRNNIMSDIPSINVIQ